MDVAGTTLAFYGLGMGALATSLVTLKRRLELSKAKHRSLTGHARMSRRVAALLPFYEYGEDRFFCSDAAPADVAARRRDGFMRLSALYEARFADSIRRTAEVADGISDLQFTEAYRVPFQYSRFVRAHLRVGAFVQSSEGVTVTDLDGNRFYDLTGSYGVNLLGNDAYKEMMQRGLERVRDLGPVLGPYHPVIADNVRRLKEISGLDEVSFHMSGTEAVMQAVRLARYHTRRSHLVRFCGAYHGWWGDVQPGVGNPVPAHETYTLKDMSEDSLRVLRTRRDIACVLVNPLQSLHPNGCCPGRHLAGRRRAVGAIRQGCLCRLAQEAARGLHRARHRPDLRRGVRRLPPRAGGAQEYFGVRADLVTYGKTVGGGFPVGVVCGRRDLMKRFREDRPADICFARGTFNSHPAVMGAMDEFLRYIETPQARDLYLGLDELWNGRARRLNALLRDEALPVQMANLSSIWTVCYTRPSRYNWMLQYYLRAEGLALSWIGTGRLIFSLNYSQADFDEVAVRFVNAVQAMERDGWFWCDAAATNRSVKRGILKEMIAHRFAALRNHRS